MKIQTYFRYMVAYEQDICVLYITQFDLIWYDDIYMCGLVFMTINGIRFDSFDS